jgi:hypothetical protein
MWCCHPPRESFFGVVLAGTDLRWSGVFSSASKTMSPDNMKGLDGRCVIMDTRKVVALSSVVAVAAVNLVRTMWFSSLTMDQSLMAVAA